MATLRHTGSALTLILEAAGPPKVFRGKLARYGHVLAGYGNAHRLRRRLERLHRLGIIEEIPTNVQLAVGSYDMLRFFISPAAADYYKEQGIAFGFHQLLRWLDEPASLADPIGLLSTRDGIIGHLMQVVHANPVYDLELLTMFDGGHDELERQLEQMIAGTHPRARSIGATMEEEGYHARLLEFTRAWRKNHAAPPLLRSNMDSFSEAERTFGTMTNAFRYFATMPKSLVGAMRHIRTQSPFS